jgi:hypothetical protein
MSGSNHVFIAGFDFGTSYSKVVVRDLITERFKIVVFSPDDSGLYPSFVLFDGDRYFPPGSSRPGTIISYLKLLAADHSTNRIQYISLHRQNDLSRQSVLRCLCAYFLFVLQEIATFLRKDPEWHDFNTTSDSLIIQFSVPSGLLLLGSRKLESLMKEALMAARIIWDTGERFPDGIASSRIDAALAALATMEAARLGKLGHLCCTYPEAAAAVQTVFRMGSVPPYGKYITMDVGAGTVDLNVFLRHTDPLTESPGLRYWACKVAPLGAAHLEELHRDAGDHETAGAILSGSEMRKKLQESITGLLKEAFRFQPRVLEGTGGNPWSRSTYAYIFGGGSGHVLYRQVLNSVLSAEGVLVPDVLELPVPSEAPNPPAGLLFGRWAVAFGLSFALENLEEIHLPDSLKPHPEPEQGAPYITRQPAKRTSIRVPPNRPGQCPYCGKDVPSIRYHIELKSCPMLLLQVEEWPVSKKRYTCPFLYCGMVFSLKEHLERHYLLYHQNEVPPAKSYSGHSRPRKITNQPPRPSLAVSPNGKVKCPTCGKNVSKAGYKMHVKAKHSRRSNS